MSAGTLNPPSSGKINRRPFMQSGDHLTASQFLRCFEAMPDVKKAELIQGIAYMASPVRLDQHGKPDGIIQGWLAIFAAEYPEIIHAVNTTMKLGRDDVPQPDGLLYREGREPEDGIPTCFVDHDGYLNGPADLVVEIAGSSASLDAREKRVSYRRAGVREYILWRTEDETIDWWVLDGDEYVSLSPDADGKIHSPTFPGLVLNIEAALAHDAAGVLDA